MRQSFNLAAVALVATACNTELDFEPGSVSFDSPALGVANSTVVTVRNVGRRKAKDVVVSTSEPFEASAVLRELKPGASLDVELLFTPTEVGSHEGTLRVVSEATRNQPLTAPINAEVLAPAASVQGQAFCGAEGDSDELRVNIENSGEGPLVITQATISDDGGGAYHSLLEVTPMEVPAGGAAWLQLTCDPDATTSGTLEVLTNDPSLTTSQIALFSGALRLEIHEPANNTAWASNDSHAFSATATAAGDVEAIAATWSSSVDGVFFEEEVVNGEVFGITPTLSAGDHSISLIAIATDGSTALDTRRVVVSTPPTAEISRPSNGTISEEGSHWTFSGDVWDPDQPLDTLTVRWLSSIDGEIGVDSLDEKGHTVSELVSLSPGTHTISLQVQDEYGFGGGDSVTFLVNQVPSVAIISPKDGSVSGQRLTLEAVISDGEDTAENLYCRWSSDLDGTLANTWGEEPEGTCTASVNADTSGEHEITLEVEDRDGGTSEASVRVSVDLAPTMDIRYPADQAWRTQGAELWMAGRASDQEDLPDDLVVEVTSDIDGSLGTITPDSDGRWSLDITGLSAGSHDLYAIVTDSLGNTDERGIDVEIVDCSDTVDNDLDGYSPADGDCDDNAPSIYPGSTVDLGNPRGGCIAADIFTITGDADADNLAYSLSAADLDGDGLDDLVMSSYAANGSAGSNSGIAWLIPASSPRLDAAPVSTDLITIEGANASQALGYDSCTVPDLNSDGRDELVLSASYGTGSLYLFTGRGGWSSTDTSSATSVIMAGGGVQSLGYDLDGADFDGDGLGDLAVGAPQAEGSTTNAGVVYLFGGTALLAGGNTDDADVFLDGASSGDAYGDAVAAVGDVDGDGLPDLLVGSPMEDTAASNAGKVELYTGLALAMISGEAPSPTAEFHGELTNNYLGDEDLVAGAGDVNGDSYADLLMAANGYDTRQTDAGKVYLVLGGPELEGTFDLLEADTTIVGVSDDSFLGDALSSAGDLDGDGLGDLLVGARYDDTPASNAGRVSLWYGAGLDSLRDESVLSDADQLLEGTASSDYAGYAVLGGFDMDGQGPPDFAVTAHGYGSDGGVYLYLNHGQSCTAE